MSKDNPKNPAWKHGASPSKPPANTSRKPWQPLQQASAAKAVNPRSRFRKRAAIGGVFGILLIAAMAIVFSLVGCQKAPTIVFIAPETSTTLSSPANVYGANSVQALADWAGADKNKNRPHVVNDAGTTRSRDGWRDALDKVSSETIVLYFAAHGAADRNGPYLWMPPADAVGIDEAHKLPVKEILQRLAEPKYREKQKLVIFDATEVSASWAHGYLHNDFARGLKTLDKMITDIPNLVVICSTDDDQRSWVVEEYKRTAFGYFLESGLKNSAGGEHPRVNAAVLFDYIGKEVKEWARTRRDVVQTPILLPTSDGKSRAEKIEIVSNANEKAVPPGTQPDFQAFSVPQDLSTAWDSADKLALREPPPETATPYVWRTYLDTLLRWEYLVRAGAPTDAIQGRVVILERELRQDLFESDPPCLANSLSVPLAFGQTIEPINQAAFSSIWRPLKEENPDNVWTELVNTARAKGGERAVTLLRLAAVTKVLETIEHSVNEEFQSVLKRAAEVLAIVDRNQISPIESHLVQVLQSFGDPKLPRKQAIRAFALRVEAERVALLSGAPGTGYAYAEQVHRWIRTQVREADRERQRGEDMLFAEEAESWKRGDAHFAAAETLYKAAAANGRIVAEALRLRDRVFARLPYYARWMAGYRGDLPAGEIERLMVLIEKIADDAHQLSQLLEEVPDDAAKRLAEIKNRTGGMAANVKELEGVYDADARKLTGNVLPSNWHALDNALTVPFLPADRRAKLLNDLRAVSSELLRKGQPQAGQTSATASDAKMFAQRQGRMALAILGQRWVEDTVARETAPRGKLALHFKDLQQRIANPAISWWETIGEVGEQIGWHWRMMPPNIHKDLDEAGAVELKATPKLLTRASYLNRLLDSATPLAAGKLPAAEDRRYWTHELLLWQARRTADDGWAKLDRGSTAKEYCEEAGERYAYSAQKLILGATVSAETTEGKRRLAAVDWTRGLLKAPEFSLTNPKMIPLSENLPFKVNYGVTPAAGLSVGYPILRVRPGQGSIAVVDNKQPTRQPILDFTAAKPASTYERAMQFAFGKVEAENARGKVNVDLLYRGRAFDMSSDVVLLGRPDIDWIYDPPVGDARFAILGARELQQGAICLLIDISDSMKLPTLVKDANGRTPRRIDAVISAIEEVLAKLPSGTMLSVALFHGDRTNQKEHVDWLTDVPVRWVQNKEASDDLRKKISGIKLSPFNAQFTPIAKSFEKAIKLGNPFPANHVGFRSVVLLTDGEDNDTRDFDHGSLVANLLRASNDDIALHMILFSLDEKSEKIAERQFAKATIKEDFEHVDRTPATIRSGVQTQKDLARELAESMLPKVQILTGVEKVERLPNGLPISLIKSRSLSLSPYLKEGTYQLSALRSRKRLLLERGDRVLLQMVPKGNRLELQVPLYADVVSDIDDTKRADSKDGRAHLTVTRNSLTDTGKSIDLEMVTTLEKRIKGEEDELRIQRPWFVWFEVQALKANNDAKPNYLRIRNLHERVAPAWDVYVGAWPATADKTEAFLHPAQPQVKAWWIDAFPGDDGRIVITRLDRLADEVAKFKEVTVGRSRVKVDITIEGDQLKVVAEHEKDKPIVVRVEGLKRGTQRLQLGERHQFFSTANQYIARFGKLARDDYERPITLQFFTLDRLKENASYVEFNTEKPKRGGEDLLPHIK